MTRKILIGALFALAWSSAVLGIASAQSIPTAPVWKTLGGYILPINSSNGIKIPQLGGSGTKCLHTDNTGIVATASADCGSGSSGGLITGIHADGTAITPVNATTSSDVGRGTALQTAVAACQAGDIFYLAPSTFDVQNAPISHACGTGSFSLIGSGKYSTIIKSSYAFSTSAPYKQPVIQFATSSVTADLSIYLTAAPGTFQAAWGSINGTAASSTLRNVYSNCNTDCIYLLGVTSGSWPNTRVYNFSSDCSWDCVVQGTVGAGSTLDIYNSDLLPTAVSTINSGAVARGVIANSNGAAQTVNLWNDSIVTKNGSSVCIRVSASFNSTVNIYGGNYSGSSGCSGTDLDFLQSSSGVINVASDVSYNNAKIQGTVSPIQAGSLSSYIVATSTTATSTFSGGLAVQTSGLVVNRSNGYVGIGVKTPLYPFQVGYSFTSNAPGALSATQTYDNNGECYTADNDNVVGHLYSYRIDPLTGNPVASLQQTFLFTDNGSFDQYFNHFTWGAASSVDGYWLEVEDGGTNGEFDNWIQLGLVTSYDDDGCRNDGQPSFESPSYPSLVVDSSGHVGMGVVPATGNQLSLLNSNTSALDIYTANNTGGNNSNGDIRIIDPSNNNIIFKIGGTGNGTGSAFIQQGAQSLSNSILSEWDIGNTNSASPDKRMVVLQGLTDTTASNAQIVFAPANGGGGTPILMEMRGSLGRTAFSSTNLSYGTNMGSTITDYGNFSVGSAYSNISAPPNGAIIAGQTGVGTSSPWATLSVSTSTQNNGSVPLFAVASTTNATLFEIQGNGNVGINTTSSDSALDVNGSVRFEGNSRIVTGSISGAIVGLGCDLADTTSPVTLASTTVFITTPKSYPGDGLTWQSYALNSTTIRTKLCSDVTVTPAASTYNVVIIR